MKTCSHCGATLPVEGFNRDRSRPDGRFSWCKVCKRASDAARYRANPEPVIQRMRTYYRDQHATVLERQRVRWRRQRERERALLRARYAADPVKYRELTRRYYRSHRSERAAYAKRYLQTHRSQASAQRRLRRGRLRAGGGRVSVAQWLALVERYGGRCLACGSDGPLTMDHVVPLARGGLHDISNLQPLCRPCNLQKWLSPRDYRGVS
jgi:5-methylcytosine-specific restriction endonuclease McrA